MAHFTMELPETYASITRPVAYDIIKQLLSRMAVDHAIPIYYPGANGKRATWNSNVKPSQDAANFNTKEHVSIQVKEDYIEEDLLTMYTRQEYNPWVFADPTCQIYLRPVYSRTKVTAQIQYKTRDRFQAESFRDHWRRKIAENREYMTFTAKYTYPIPQVTIDAIELLYMTRLNRLKEFDDFKKYLEWYSTEAITLLTNSAGKGDTVAVEETQTMIHGQFTDVAPPEADKDDKGAVWTVAFDFEYYYDKVISVNLQYPIMVQNHLVPQPLLPEPFFDLATFNSKLAKTRDWYSYIQRYMGYLSNVGGAYLRIPEFDDWVPKIRYETYDPILSVMLTVDEENPHEIFALTDMGEYKMIEVMHDSFKRHHQYLTKPYETPFLIQLYKDGSPVSPDEVYVDDQLNIKAKYPMDASHMYHVTVSCLHEIRMLTREAEERFFKDPQMVYCWMDIRYGRTPGLRHPIQEQHGLPKGDYKEILEKRQQYQEMRRNKNGLYNGYDDSKGKGGYQLPKSILDPYTPVTDMNYPKILPNGMVDFNEFRKTMKQFNLSEDGNFAYHEPGKVMSTLAFFSVITRRNPHQE